MPLEIVKLRPAPSDRTTLDDRFIKQSIITCLKLGKVDMLVWLASTPDANAKREQILKLVLAETAEPIEILTFHWGFRLMLLRPTRSISELYADAELAERGHRLDLLPHHKTATENCPKCK